MSKQTNNVEFDMGAFRDKHMISLKGKYYLPVAARVLLFRKEHPNWRIITETREVADVWHVYCTVYNEEGAPLSSAYKRIRYDARGPASEYPVETAETGAIGRALALVGYGTLSGDLEEGDKLSDSPVDRTSPHATLKELIKSLKIDDSVVLKWLTKANVKSIDQLHTDIVDKIIFSLKGN